jgi:hypothetical protein
MNDSKFIIGVFLTPALAVPVGGGQAMQRDYTPRVPTGHLVGAQHTESIVALQEELEDHMAMQRALAKMPSPAEIRRIIASRPRPADWYDGDAPSS